MSQKTRVQTKEGAYAQKQRNGTFEAAFQHLWQGPLRRQVSLGTGRQPRVLMMRVSSHTGDKWEWNSRGMEEVPIRGAGPNSDATQALRREEVWDGEQEAHRAFCSTDSFP